MLPASHRFVSKKLQQCNWAQACEGGLDTAHFSFLHMPVPSVAEVRQSDAPRPTRAALRWMRDDPMPEFTMIEHDVGFVVGGSRRADNDQSYWRVDAVHAAQPRDGAPAMPGRVLPARRWVPIDDESCWIYTLRVEPGPAADRAERARFAQGGFGRFAEIGPDWVPLRNRGNDYLIDRDEQKHRSFTGIEGIVRAGRDEPGQPGPDRRSHARAPRPDRRGDRALSPRSCSTRRGRLPAGREPEAPRRPASYRVRAGGALTPSRLSFAEVMRERFGSETGKVQA